MYESWQVIPQGHCLFDSSTLPPTAPLIMVFMYFGSTRRSKMATLTIEAVDRGSQWNGTDSAPRGLKESTAFTTMLITYLNYVLLKEDTQVASLFARTPNHIHLSPVGFHSNLLITTPSGLYSTSFSHFLHIHQPK